MSRYIIIFIKAFSLMMLTILGIIVISLIVYSMSHRGAFVELFLAIVITFIALIMFIMMQSYKPDNSDEPEATYHFEYKPPSNLPKKIGLTLVVFGVAAVAGMVWLLISLYGSDQMLMTGWVFIAVITILAWIVIWASGTPDE